MVPPTNRDPVVRNAKRNLGPWVAFLALAIATAAAVFAYSAKDQSSNTATKVDAAGPPCVDTAKGPKVLPSVGCKKFFEAIVNLCAQQPRFCARSEKRAAQAAQVQATDQAVGPIADVNPVPRGGGNSPGTNNPRSPNTPSQPPQGDGGGGGGSGGGDGTTTEPPPKTEPIPKEKPPVDVPGLIEKINPQLCQVPNPLGPPLIRLC